MKTQISVRFPQIILLLVLLAGMFIRLTAPKPASTTPDERTYTIQANQLIDKGIVAGYQQLINDYLRDANLQIYPTPTRLGVTIPIVAMMKLSGDRTEVSGIYVSALSSILGLVILALFICRTFGVWPAIWVSSLFAWNLLDISMARRAWGDSLFGLAISVLFLGTLKLAFQPKLSKMSLLILLICGGATYWTKEPGLLLALFLFFFAAIVRVILFKDKLGAFFVALCGGLSVGLHYSLLAFSVGGYGALIKLYELLKAAHVSNAYILQFQTGPAYKFIQMLITAMPGVTISIAFGTGLIVTEIVRSPNSLRQNKLLQIAVFALTLLLLELVLYSVSPGMKNLRYLSAALAPIFILASYPILALERYFRSLPLGSQRPLLVVLIIIAVAFIGYEKSRTDYFLYEKNIADLSRGFLLGL